MLSRLDVVSRFLAKKMIKEIFSNFEEMITPKLISIIFILLVISDFFSAIIIAGNFFGEYSSATTNITGIVVGIFYFVFSVIISRVLCELLIVIFKINEHTRDILLNLKEADK